MGKDPRRRRRALRDELRDSGGKADAGEVVEGFNIVPVHDPAFGGIFRIQAQDHGPAGGNQVLLTLVEHGIQRPEPRHRDEPQRLRTGVRRHPPRHRLRKILIHDVPLPPFLHELKVIREGHRDRAAVAKPLHLLCGKQHRFSLHMVQKLPEKILLRLPEIVVLKAHGFRKALKSIPVRPALSRRVDHLRRRGQRTVAVSCIYIRLLHRVRGGKDDVREPGRVRHHPLVHHREQVLAGQAAQHRFGVTEGIRRVAGVDIETPDRRVADPRPQLVDVDRRVVSVELRHVDKTLVNVSAAGGVAAAQTAAGLLPRPGVLGQDHDDPGCHPAVRVAGKAGSPEDDRRLCLPVFPGQSLDPLRRHAADLRRPFRRVLRKGLPEGLVAVGPGLQILPVREILPLQDMHHRQGHRPVGAGAYEDDVVAVWSHVYGADLHRHDPLTLLPVFPDLPHHWISCRGHITAPADHKIAVLCLPRVEAAGTAHHRFISCGFRVSAQGAHKAAASQTVEEREPAFLLDVTHDSGIVAPGDGLGAALPNDILPAGADLPHRLVPADPFKGSFALRAGPPHGIQDPVRRIDGTLVAGHLPAGTRRRHRVFGIRMHSLKPPVLDLRIEPAGRRAVVRADGVSGL